MKKSVVAVAAAIAVVGLLSGCSSAGSPKASSTPTPTPVQYETAPLTGVQYVAGTNDFLAGPSVACKIDNLDVARPQQGLNSTDMVFDEMVEGGLTRFVAVFHSQLPTNIGPVRSIRPMDPDIISPFGGIVCYSGGQLKFVNMMRATRVFNANETEEQGKGTFSRTADREAPHNVIVNVQKLQSAHTDLSAPQPVFKFATTADQATAALQGTVATSLKVYYPAALAQWTPSSDGKLWQRTQDGKPLTDKLDGSRIHATNVVVLDVAVDHRTYGYVPKTLMNSSGTGWVFTGGKYVTVNWHKTDQNSPIVLTMADGSDVLLAPGNTWVELKPRTEGNIKIESPKPTPTPTPKK